jgi:hypothetical protein
MVDLKGEVVVGTLLAPGFIKFKNNSSCKTLVAQRNTAQESELSLLPGAVYQHA